MLLEKYLVNATSALKESDFSSFLGLEILGGGGLLRAKMDERRREREERRGRGEETNQGDGRGWEERREEEKHHIFPRHSFRRLFLKRNPKEEKRRVVQKSGLTLEKQGVGKREHSLRVQILRKASREKVSSYSPSPT